jgi:hypothetical protein
MIMRVNGGAAAQGFRVCFRHVTINIMNTRKQVDASDVDDQVWEQFVTVLHGSCPQCGYECFHAPSSRRCPECGVRFAISFGSSSRSWSLGAIGALAAHTGAIVATYQHMFALRHGFPFTVPFLALYVVMLVATFLMWIDAIANAPKLMIPDDRRFDSSTWLYVGIATAVHVSLLMMF